MNAVLEYNHSIEIRKYFRFTLTMHTFAPLTEGKTSDPNGVTQ